MSCSQDTMEFIKRVGEVLMFLAVVALVLCCALGGLFIGFVLQMLFGISVWWSLFTGIIWLVGLGYLIGKME